MEEHEVINAAVAAHGVELAGEIILNPAIANGIYLPLKLSRDASGRQSPSHRDLANLRSDLAGYGFQAEYLFVDKETRSLEDRLRASLISSFPEYIRNSFLTVSAGSASIWIDNKKQIPDEYSEIIRAHILEFLSRSNITKHHIYVISEESLATNTETLAIIRKLSPVDCQGLSQALSARGFSVPSDDWINRRFDALRKAGLVIRLSNRTYVLTAEALHRLGTLKNRYSPDIGRLLALARRPR